MYELTETMAAYIGGYFLKKINLCHIYSYNKFSDFKGLLMSIFLIFNSEIDSHFKILFYKNIMNYIISPFNFLSLNPNIYSSLLSSKFNVAFFINC